MNKEVQRYLDAVPAERRPLFDKLQAVIMGLYPNTDIVISYRIPTYNVGSGWVALANQKHHVSLYTNGAHHIAEFKAKYPGIKTGTGCINFKVADPLPAAVINQVIRHAIEHPK